MSLSELAAIRKRLEQKRKRETSPAAAAVTNTNADQANTISSSPKQTSAASENASSAAAHTNAHALPCAAAASEAEQQHASSSQRGRRLTPHHVSSSVSPTQRSNKVHSSTPTRQQVSPNSSSTSPHSSDYNPHLSIPASARQSGAAIPMAWLPHDSRQSLSQDLSQHFVNQGSRGDRPQNFIDVSDDCGDPEFECYLARRDQVISHANAAAPYMAEKCDLRRVELKQLLQGQEFDVIMIDPPWKEYTERVAVASLTNSHGSNATAAPAASSASAAVATENTDSYWDLESIARLPIIELAAEPCVLFLWCGSGSHVAEGHELLKRWGFNKAEDICWIQTNADAKHAQVSGFSDPLSVFQRTFEHCIMGIKGREYILRDRDMKPPGDSSQSPNIGLSYRERMDLGMVQFVAPGCEVDCFVSELEEEESEARSAVVPPNRRSISSDSNNPHGVACRKPLGFYKLIERFCVGRRRLELFGTEHNIRNGWLTLGSAIGPEWSNLNMERYRAMFERPLELPPPLLPSHFTHSSTAAVAGDTFNAIRGSPSKAAGSTSSAAAPFDARVAGHYLTFDSYSEMLRPRSPTTRVAPVPVRRPARPRKGALISVGDDHHSHSHTSPTSAEVSERFPRHRPISHITNEMFPRSQSPQPLFDARSHYSREGAQARAMQDQQQHMLRQSIYQTHR